MHVAAAARFRIPTAKSRIPTASIRISASARADAAAPGFGALDAFVPTNLLAAVACWVGIFSILLCGLGVVLGPIAIVTGVISRKKGAVMEESGYGKAASTARTWIGIVTGAIGTIVSIVFIIMMLVGKR